jgi:hypothetical protein
MTVRITLSDDETTAAGIPIVPPVKRTAPREQSVPAFADWDDDQRPALLLFLADEPEIGRRFSYSGVDWEIVDYRNGWVARLLVD